MFYVDVFLLDINVFIESDFFFLLEHTTSSSSSSSSSKRPRLDQIPAANLDADDPLTDVHTLSYRCLGMQVDFDGSLKNVSVYVLGWRWLRFRLRQWRWYCRSASWTGEDQKGASWGTREEGKPHWSFTTFVTLIDYRKIKPFRMILGSVLCTSLITSEIKWQIQDDIIALIRIWLIRFFERNCCWWLVWQDWVIWWFKRGYASILETTISNVAIGWWQDSNVMTSYH